MITASRLAIAGIVCALLFAGCGRDGTVGAMPVSGAVPALAGGWISPDAVRGDLLYVTDLNHNAVNIYTYPAGRLVGTLTGFSAPHGVCSDNAGHVFVTNGTKSQIVEFAHGGTHPIAVLHYPHVFPNSCAVDPTTGNLAVTASPFGSGPDHVAIFDGARGEPHAYGPSNVYYYYFADYDRHGNLYLDGLQSNGNVFEFTEVPAGAKTFNPITLQHHFILPGGIQWLGDELVVGDQVNFSGPSAVYEFSVKGNAGRLTGQTPLVNSCDVLEFHILGTRLIATDDCGAAVRYFAFPAGGNSVKKVDTNLSQPVGLAISRKP